MSHPVFRLAPRTERPTLSWVSGSVAKQSLISLVSWVVKGLRPHIVDVNPLPALKAVKGLHLAHLSHVAVGNSETHVSSHEKATAGRCVGVITSQPLVSDAQFRHAHLKVVMVRDGHASQNAQGVRMVISGRMADVCAELDRLAA
jgi:hypothetical protein